MNRLLLASAILLAPAPLVAEAAPPALRGVAAAIRAATLEPSANGYINAAQVYPFAEGRVYRLYTAPGRVTDIALEAGETLVSVAAGDTARWTVGDTTSGSGASRRTHVLVKPFAPGLSTNLVITTDRRAYHLALIATPATAMAAVSWRYPEGVLLALERPSAPAAAATAAQGLSVDQLDFDYAITGDRPTWRPRRAFDDGRQTYIEFPRTIETGEAPPLFIVGPKGEASVVNYRMKGRFYVVDRLFDSAELRLGAKKQVVVRIKRTRSGVSAS